MITLKTLASTAVLGFAFTSSAFANTPDAYVLNFRDSKNSESQILDLALSQALPMTEANIEEVVIDISTAAKWEKAAYEAFDREIVPIFNQWVGLPGFAAIVDADTKSVIGCVNGAFTAEEMAQKIREMTAKAAGQAYLSKASVTTKSTQCPPVFNQPPSEVE